MNVDVPDARVTEFQESEVFTINDMRSEPFPEFASENGVLSSEHPERNGEAARAVIKRSGRE